MSDRVPVTVLIAARDEEPNLSKCLAALAPAERVVVLDSQSRDRTAELAAAAGAEVVQFRHAGGYPKKRQWAMDTLDILTDWVLLLDADEVVPPALWDDVRAAVADPKAPNGYFITKGFHFLGRRFRFGGFSFAAVLLVRRGRARFERLVDDPAGGLDMEVHERMIVDGPVGRLRTPLVHDDFKGLEAYFDRHNRYSSWEARLRHRFLASGTYGEEQIRPRLFGNAQERRRFLKYLAVRVPGESVWWFLYHYVLRLGFLEGRPGLIASRFRSDYIAAVRAKVYELRRAREAKPLGSNRP
jgi:glycosyltransferase involved in cell wall biosynthesis